MARGEVAKGEIAKGDEPARYGFDFGSTGISPAAPHSVQEPS